MNLYTATNEEIALSMEELFKEKAKEKEHARKTSTCQNSDKSFEEIDTGTNCGAIRACTYQTKKIRTIRTR